MTHRIFVYGTLKRGCSNAHYMAGQQFVAEVQTQPCYRLYDCGGYPGMIESPDGLSIRGEVWDVDEACRARLDVLEDVAVGLYECVPVRLLTQFDGDSVLTYLYRWDVRNKPDAGDEWRDK